MKIFEKVYSIVARIPEGKVMTYKQVAELSGIKNPRVVGFALSANENPKEIPCHRVVASNGSLKGYAFGGVEKKKQQLEEEGVVFLHAGKIDLSKSLTTIS